MSYKPSVAASPKYRFWTSSHSSGSQNIARRTPQQLHTVTIARPNKATSGFGNYQMTSGYLGTNRRTVVKKPKGALYCKRWYRIFCWLRDIGYRLHGNCRCGAPITPATADLAHDVAVAKGGRYDQGNLVITCRSCNLAMGTQNLQAWFKNCRIENDYIEVDEIAGVPIARLTDQILNSAQSTYFKHMGHRKLQAMNAHIATTRCSFRAAHMKFHGF
jgi:hypothetical protein